MFDSGYFLVFITSQSASTDILILSLPFMYTLVVEATLESSSAQLVA